MTYGPEEYGGMGMISIAGEQAVVKITKIIKHMRVETDMGDTRVIGIRWTQVMTGTRKSILADTGKYISNLREAMQNIHGQ
eukprot:8098058-Ditylum_brightwellii.AAC.2